MILALLLLLTPATALADRAEVLDAIAKTEIEMLHADEQLRGAAARVRTLEEELEALEGQLEALNERLAEREERLALRLRAMYRARHRGFLPLLFSASSPHELLRNARSLWWIVKADHRSVDRWQADRLEAEALAARIEEERQQLLVRAGTVYTKREELKTLREARQAQLGSLPVASRKRSRVIEEAASRAVDVSIDLRKEKPPELEVDTATPSSTFEQQRGLLPLPAVGSIVPSGRGIALLASAGDPIRAVHGGRVSKVLHIRGYGLVAIVDHGDGWHTVYGHADGFDVGPGERVASGQVLGRVGETGSLEGPRLHFEVRHQRSAEDPLDWLRVPSGVRVSR